MIRAALPTPVANVAAYLPEMAKRQPDVRAILAPREGLMNRARAASALEYEEASYAELDRLTAELAAGLAEVGIDRGDRVVLMVPPSIPFFALVFALFQAGVVPVVLDPGMGPSRLTACIERASPKAFIGVARAHLARLALGWGRGSVQTNVVVGALPRVLGAGAEREAISLEEVRLGGARVGRAKLADVEPDDVAAILFTSGSTGVPKGAIYTHGNFLAQVEAIRAMYDIAPGEIDLPTFPLFALFDPALGMTTVLPRMDFTKPGSVNADEIIAPIRRFGVTNMFGSPALLDRVASSHAARRGGPGEPLLPTLRRVITAGAAVVPRILESFARLLPPGARIHTPYGATEALPIATIDHTTLLTRTRPRTIAGAGVAVGRPVASVEVRILRIADDPIERFSDADCVARGEVGEIAVSGPQVTRSYFRDEPNTRLHKTLGPDGRLFHRVGDVGSIDEEGALWYAGRKAHRVEVAGRTYFSEQVEGPFNAQPAVRRTAFVGPSVNGRIVPTLCVEPLEPITSPRGPWVEQVLSVVRVRGAGRLAAGRFGLVDGRTSARMLRRWIDPALRRGVGGIVERFFVFERFPVDPRHNAKIHREELRAECARLLALGEGVGWEVLEATFGAPR